MRSTVLLACTLTFGGTGCAMTSHGAQPPPQWDPAQATLEEQYEQHKVVCEGDWLRTCLQAGTRRRFAAMGPVFAQYTESDKVNQRVAVRAGVLYTLFGVSIASGVTGLVAPNWFPSDKEDARREAHVSLALLGTSLVTALAGVIAMRNWDPGKKMDEAYNAALRRDLEEAYATNPTTTPATATLDATLPHPDT